MANENKRKFRSERHDRFWTGLILLVVGGFLLADKMGVDFPHWVFSWPMIVILVGIVTGFKHRFQNLSWLIFIGVGLIFLSDEMLDGFSLKNYIFPIVIIGFGLLFIMRPKKKWCRDRDRWYDGVSQTNVPPTTGFEPEPIPGDDTIESVSIFGGVKKVITSKNFKGGEIVCFMGGAEYNLSQSDIIRPITIEIVQVFGGTKLIVPPHWEVRSESVAIFGGIEDKRPTQPGTFDPNKILIIRGTTIFGGIEIKSY